MYNWRSDDEAFRTEWDDALATITENIESALAKAALGGDTVSMVHDLLAQVAQAGSLQSQADCRCRRR
jgi:hypothetical protein